MTFDDLATQAFEKAHAMLRAYCEVDESTWWKQFNRSLAPLLDSVVVRHGGGGGVQAGESVLSFKSFEKGRENGRARRCTASGSTRNRRSISIPKA